MTRVKGRDRRAYFLAASPQIEHQRQSQSQGQEGNTSLSKLIITERDRAVLSFIGTGGLASLSQLQRLFWPQSKNTRCCRARLAQLEQREYVQSWFVDVLHQRGLLVFSLTRKGALSFFGEKTRQYFYTGLPPKTELTQQFLGQEARIALTHKLNQENKELVDWKNEHQLRGEGWQKLGGLFRSGRAGRLADIPDAQALIRDKSSGELSALDIEIDGDYFGRMLDKKLTSLARKNHPVLWVTSSQRRVEQVSQRLSGERETSLPSGTGDKQLLQTLQSQLQYLVVASPPDASLAGGEC